MRVLRDKPSQKTTGASPTDISIPIRQAAISQIADQLQPVSRTAREFARQGQLSNQWGQLMIAAQGGEQQAYQQLLRELDRWLRRYYARRLPGPAADDARQDALLAIHVNRHTYTPSRPFGPWIAAIARYKWIDHIRAQVRSTALPLHCDIPVEDHEESTTSAVAIGDLLRQLKPAQADVIRLVKLQGTSIEDASSVTGQSKSLVKVNIHRGLKRLAALAIGNGDATSPTADARLDELKRPVGRASSAPSSASPCRSLR